MIDKIKDWLYWKSGIDFEAKHIWMILILIFSIILLILSLAFNGGFSSGVPFTPDNGVGQQGMHGAVPQLPAGK